MESKMEKKIELSKVTFIVFIIVAIMVVFCTNSVFAENTINAEGNTSNNKYTFKFDFGTGVSKDGNLTIKWDITTDGTVNYSSMIAISGILQYDAYAFESPTMQGANGFTATFNSENGKFVLDASGFTEGQEIATITLKAKSIPADTNSEIGIGNLQLATGDSDTEINKTYLKIGDVKVPANIYGSENNQETVSNESAEYWQNVNGDPDENVEDITNNSSNNEMVENTNNTAKSEYISPISKDPTTSNKPIPQTGMKITIFVVIGVMIVIGVVTFIRYKKFYD